MELARQHDTTVAKILHLAITDRAKQEQVTIMPRTQIPMILPSPTIAVNGSLAAAFASKPKGVKYE